MNFYDSHKVKELMQPHGYTTTESKEDADLIVLNTCHIREKAAEKVYSELGRIKKESKDKAQVVVAGCVAQAEGDEILKRANNVDYVVGPQSLHQLPQMLARNIANTQLEMPPNEKFDALPEQTLGQGASAFLSVQEGCDKFCTFCVVPYTRGAEYSRPVTDILKEAQQLVDKGALEINLLGQNVNAYHGEGSNGNIWSLAQLLEEIAKIDGLQRLNYTTSHPRDMSDDLINQYATNKKLMPFLHLPVQAGSDKVLKSMNRKHKADLYLDIINKLRKANPNIAFSSDFIVGFPGESDADFEDTLNLVKGVNYAQCYSFKYSKRPGTPGSVRDDQVPEEIKDERLQRLQALLNQQQFEFNNNSVGRTMQVLFHKSGKHDGQIIGKSQYMQSVIIEGADSLIGTMQNVKITKAGDNSVHGELVN